MFAVILTAGTILSLNLLYNNLSLFLDHVSAKNVSSSCSVLNYYELIYDSVANKINIDLHFFFRKYTVIKKILGIFQHYMYKVLDYLFIKIY